MMLPCSRSLCHCRINELEIYYKVYNQNYEKRNNDQLKSHESNYYET